MSGVIPPVSPEIITYDPRTLVSSVFGVKVTCKQSSVSKMCKVPHADLSLLPGDAAIMLYDVPWVL